MKNLFLLYMMSYRVFYVYVQAYVYMDIRVEKGFAHAAEKTQWNIDQKISIRKFFKINGETLILVLVGYIWENS